MNGPAHYREAERLIDIAEDGGRDVQITATLLAAQAHATLAAAAATLGSWCQHSDLAADEWGEAVSS